MNLFILSVDHLSQLNHLTFYSIFSRRSKNEIDNQISRDSVLQFIQQLKQKDLLLSKNCYELYCMDLLPFTVIC